MFLHYITTEWSGHHEHGEQGVNDDPTESLIVQKWYKKENMAPLDNTVQAWLNQVMANNQLPAT